MRPWKAKSPDLSMVPVRVTEISDLISTIDAEYFGDKFFDDSTSLSLALPLVINDVAQLQRHSQLLVEKQELVDEYIERKFLLERYYPQAQGRLLDVGVNKPNLHDSQALPNPELHWTIDIDPSVAQFGSAKHQTIDFFEFTTDEPFAHVIMFGLVGTPNNRTATDAHIIFDLNDALIDHAAGLVAAGGGLVIGPELSSDSRAAADTDVRRWIEYFEQCEALLEQFTLVYALRGRCNLITVFRKRS
jgi:hypothetical protein